MTSRFEDLTKAVILILAIRAVLPGFVVSLGYACTFTALVVFSLLTQTKKPTQLDWPKEEFEKVKAKVAQIQLAMGFRKID